MPDELATPPEDADEWSDQQWIDWLKATDDTAEATDQAAPVTTGSRVAHSPGGRLLGDAMTGLAQALYGARKEEPAVVAESGEPVDDQPLELHLDFEHPDKSYAVLKDIDPTAR